MADQVQTPLSILRRKQVEARTGLARSTIYERIAAGTFPSPVNLGGQQVGWVESEIEAWIADRIQQSRQAPSPALTLSLKALAAEAAKHSPDMLIQFDGMKQPMRLADALEWIKGDVSRDLEQAHLSQVAAECKTRKSK